MHIHVYMYMEVKSSTVTTVRVLKSVQTVQYTRTKYSLQIRTCIYMYICVSY